MDVLFSNALQQPNDDQRPSTNLWAPQHCSILLYSRLRIFRHVWITFCQTNSHVHQHYTRNSNILHKVFTRTNHRKHTVLIKGIDIWNKLSNELRNIKSYAVFRKSKILLSIKIGELCSL